MSGQRDYPSSKEIPGQRLPYPAKQAEMNPPPITDLANYHPADKLAGKVALVTGALSGIGRAVALAFALEGARVAILYNENDDAATTRQLVEEPGGRCLVIKGDVRNRDDCQRAVQRCTGYAAATAPSQVWRQLVCWDKGDICMCCRWA